MDLILHGQIDHVWVRRRAAQSCWEQGSALEVEDLNQVIALADAAHCYRYGFGDGGIKTYNIRSGIRGRKNIPGVGGRHDKVGDDGNSLDFFGPLELSVMADANGRLRRPLAGVNATSRRRKNFTERDLLARNIFGSEFVEVGANEASEERGSDIVGVSFC